MKPKVRSSFKNATVSNCLILAKQDRVERADPTIAVVSCCRNAGARTFETSTPLISSSPKWAWTDIESSSVDEIAKLGRETIATDALDAQPPGRPRSAAGGTWRTRRRNAVERSRRISGAPLIGNRFVLNCTKFSLHFIEISIESVGTFIATYMSIA